MWFSHTRARTAETRGCAAAHQLVIGPQKILKFYVNIWWNIWPLHSLLNHLYSLRKSKCNLYRIVTLKSCYLAVAAMYSRHSDDLKPHRNETLQHKTLQRCQETKDNKTRRKTTIVLKWILTRWSDRSLLIANVSLASAQKKTTSRSEA